MARPGTASSTGPPAAWQLIRSRDFGPYFAGNAILLGVLNIAQFAPVLLLAPWTGLAADRLDRRRLLLVTQLSAAVLSGTLAILAWGGLARVWVVIVFALCLGVSSAYAARGERRPGRRGAACPSAGTDGTLARRSRRMLSSSARIAEGSTPCVQALIHLEQGRPSSEGHSVGGRLPGRSVRSRTSRASSRQEPSWLRHPAASSSTC